MSASLRTQLVNFLSEICPALLGFPKQSVQSHLTAGSARQSQSEIEDVLGGFINDSNIRLLLVCRIFEAETEDSWLLLQTQYDRRLLSSQAIAILKRPHITTLLEEESPMSPGMSGENRDDRQPIPLGQKLQVSTISFGQGENSTFEALQNLLQNSIEPVLTTEEGVRAGIGKGVEDDGVGRNVAQVRRKLQELVSAVQQAQQASSIMHVELKCDPKVMAAVEKTKALERKATVSDMGPLASDPVYLNKLQTQVNGWSAAISQVVKKEVKPITKAVHEINYWLNLEASLKNIQEQFTSPEVELQLAVLNENKRCLFYESGTGVGRKLEEIQSINTLLRDFPIAPLHTAANLEEIRYAVQMIFVQMRKIKSATAYPLSQAYSLIEAISRDLSAQLAKVLAPQRLFEMKYGEFAHFYSQWREIFLLWDEEFRKFKELARQIHKTRGITQLPATSKFDHHQLKQRLEEIVQMRKEHQDFVKVVAQVLIAQGGANSQACLELNSNMKQLQQCDALDVTSMGQDSWEAARKHYQEKLTRFETSITQKIRERLSQAKDGNEMFRVFSEYNTLFFRPRIRSAIQEHQVDLVNQVKADFHALQKKFREGHDKTEACFAARSRDFPPNAEKVIWTRQIEERVRLALQRMEDVLGKNWDEFQDGQQIKAEVESFLRICNSKALVDSWLEEVKARKKIDLGATVFQIKRVGARVLQLEVNCDAAQINIWKEFRFFSALNVRLPYSIRTSAEESRAMYPVYVALEESLRANKTLADKFSSDPRIQAMNPLLAEEQQRVLDSIAKGLRLKWESEQVEDMAHELGKAIESVERNMTELTSTAQNVDKLLRKLRDLPPAAPAEEFRSTVDELQRIVYRLVESGYSNLKKYVEHLDQEVEKILRGSCLNIVMTWTREFRNWPVNGTVLIRERSLHEIDIVDKAVSVSPPVDAARQKWIQSFHRTVAKLGRLPRPTLSDTRSAGEVATYRDILEKIDPETVIDAYQTVENLMREIDIEVARWDDLCLIWDVDINLCAEMMGDDFEAWTQTIQEMRTTKASTSKVSDRRSFGPVTLDCSGVQLRVDQKYEQRIKEMVGLFGEKLGESTATFFTRLSAARNALEKQGDLSTAKFATVDPNTLTGQDEVTRVVASEIADYVAKIRSAKDVVQDWEARVSQIESAEQLLSANRYPFPDGWVYAERVAGEWNAFQVILSQQDEFFERYKPQLQNIVRVIDRKLREAMERVQEDWKRSKPVGGETAPQEALRTLYDTEAKIQALNQRMEKLDSAKAALGLPMGGPVEAGGMDPRIVEEEVSNLKQVWSELSSLHHNVAELKSTPWSAVQPRKVRESLEALLGQVKQIPVRYRQYEAFEKLQDDLKAYLAHNHLITELKSETLKDRHWKKILEILSIRKPLQELSLGDVYDARPKQQEEYLKDVLTRAQGESGLSEFLTTVKDYWAEAEFQFILTKSKVKLISGGDEIFTVLDDHLNLFQSMRMSPYFASFEEEANTWDDKLTRLRSILDVWLDVQRKWVYLEGVFSGSADIKALLPTEFARFKGIDTDFVGIMKRAASRPKIIDVVNQEGLLKTLTRLSEMLTKVQKALSDYLEKQRSSCPRFYFVGDEDLLEMIGNARDPSTVQRHLNKMFAGISSLSIETERPNVVSGMVSREQEIVPFVTPIEITQQTSLMTWLMALEANMVHTLCVALEKSMKELPQDIPTKATAGTFFSWITKFPTQIVILSIQIRWTTWVEQALGQKVPQDGLKKFLEQIRGLLTLLADNVESSTDRITRTKTVQLITEVVHQRDVAEALIMANCQSADDFNWLQYMRFYYKTNSDSIKEHLTIKIANAEFAYGYEYLGVSERLVQTPLTDKCYLTLTRALHLRLGGNPFGPAGTGKTETVKFLGATLGRFVLVFNCDEAFDFHAMGRIFVGLCEVGAWGCFDEFNRLEERMLSAVSEQILTIQTGLREKRANIDLLNQQVKLSPDVGIFVTLNPGYAGRSNLPDNLKQLFREFAMIVPDKSLITEVMLYSQGFETANKLAPKVVALFDLCAQQLSHQPHYDFGLRALKSVLSAAGQLKRKQGITSDNERMEDVERTMVIRSICDSLVPKLVQKDVSRIQSLLTAVFPGATTLPVEEAVLEAEILHQCSQRNFEPEASWKQKVLQLYQIQKLNHGVMLVGPTGVGKTSAWTVLLDAMERIDQVKGVSYVIDPKALSKEQLYGKLDPTTLEWTDGVFTSTLRKIVNASGVKVRYRHWIIFDGDVDPDWAENLNSVLDDNKLLTLPNGERFQVPSNVRLVFEVDTLESATLATVSRCGMVWMSECVLSLTSIFKHHLAELGGKIDSPPDVAEEMKRLASTAFSRGDTLLPGTQGLDRGGSNLGLIVAEANIEEINMSTTLRMQQQAAPVRAAGGKITRVNFGQDVYRNSEAAMKIRRLVSQLLDNHFDQHGVVMKCLELAEEHPHIMTFTRVRVVEALFSCLERKTIELIDFQEERSQGNPDELLQTAIIERVITRSLAVGVLWSFGGSMALNHRTVFARDVARLFTTGTSISLPGDLTNDGGKGGVETWTLLDYTVSVNTGEWEKWRDSVPTMEIDARQVEEATLVIETSDTRSHRDLIGIYLHERRPFILCGPPGSGKTMTLLSTLKAHQADFEICSLNFSSGTTPDMLLKTFNHYCEYVKTAGGVVLRPNTPGKWLILFCDEINLPSPDKYGTQRVISFVRQMCTSGCFWKMTQPGIWEKVMLERIQFAGACNPPTDAGRHPMSDRFLRGAPILFVDFPGPDSLKKIYGTFNRAMLRGSIRSLAGPLTEAMVEFYNASQERFTVDVQPHYIYSPRELSRWKVAVNEAVKDRSESDSISPVELVRLAVHEAQRIFRDRLVEEVHREWTDQILNEIFLRHFAGTISAEDLRGPILFTTILNGAYVEAPIEKLRQVVKGKLSVFYEEEVSVKLVLFDQCLQHVLRIDRVLRQPLGHLLLVGVSGAGKTILSKFVAWLNGLSVFQIKAGRNYDTLAFENDLRSVMKRAGVREEKITFIFDESNVLGPAFLERMNALLAAGEVPGLFEQDEYTQLIAECRAAFGGDMDESELFNRFTRQVQRNLHIVFTMNPANPDFYNRQATSPALFNRCVIDWFGDWPEDALLHVAREFTEAFAIPPEAYALGAREAVEDERRDLLAQAMVGCHGAVGQINEWLARQGKKRNFVAPRDFLDFIKHLLTFVTEKRAEASDTTHHLTVGLTKLAETETQVAELQASLAIKEAELAEKQKLSSAKMEAMVAQKAEAEEKKRDAEALAEVLNSQEARINAQKFEVQAELNEVQPLLQEAKDSVSSIPRKALDELKAMTSPPALVKMVCEAVVVLLTNSGDKAPAWEEVRRVLRGDFINRILTYDATKADVLSQATVNALKRRYLTSNDWEVSKIDNASKAAGPLSIWVDSSCKCAEIVLKVDPLRQQIAQLESALRQNELKYEKTKQLIATLENKLSQLQAEYAQLIAEEQQIKWEMEAVKRKVETSRTMLKNLTSEQKRWAQSCDESRESLTTELGDNVLASAFSTYMGFFEQGEREKLVAEWHSVLDAAQIQYREDLSMTEYLSKPAERYSWLANGLPPDDLSMENTVILRRFIRYPLIIDPSGQATDFILNLFAEKKIVKTSFSDCGFVKQLESALRFGTALLVQDVEEMDTILNNVLNQETHRAGGRILITVGEQEIDFSPTFVLFLVTRDPTVQFTPDLCSRVTLINYTTTPASLRNQCLNMVLRSERPDVEKKRRDVLKLQGEFRVKIRELEDALLNSLANVSGNILDDERVVNTLENLKKQAEEVNREAARADEIMVEVEKTTGMYIPLADAAARLYTTLEHLSSLYFLYHYDLRFFEGIFKDTLNNKTALNSVRSDDFAGRAEILLSTFFKAFYDRCTLSQLHKDKAVLALQFARIRFESMTKVSLRSMELDVLLQGRLLVNLGGHSGSLEGRDNSAPLVNINADAFTPLLDGTLRLDQRRGLATLTSNLRSFDGLVNHMKNNKAFWLEFIASDRPEEMTIPGRVGSEGAGNESFLQLPHFQTLKEPLQAVSQGLMNGLRMALLVKCLRADRLSAALDRIVSVIMGPSFLETPILSQDLLASLLNSPSISSSIPVILVSAPGFDPSNRVVAVASVSGRQLTSIAMGSEEGYVAADKAIQTASRVGTWVLLKNVHLTSTRWLQNLEKTMFKFKHHERFRIFLTMEFKDKVPANLLRLSYKFVFEPPVGIRASLERSLTSFIVPPRTERPPTVLRNRLYFYVAFLHAVVLERRRFAPIGWTKPYEFSDADLLCSLEEVDEWLKTTGSVDPSRIPWLALQTLLREVMYGGRLDNESDRRVLQTFVDKLICPRMFDDNAPLVAASGGGPELPAPPISKSIDQYIDWVRKLGTANEHPTWIGLAAHADRLLQADTALGMLTDWQVLNNRSAEELKDLLPTSSFIGVGSEGDLMQLRPHASLVSVKGVMGAPRAPERALSRLSSSLGGGHAADILSRIDLLRTSLPADALDLKPHSAEAAEDPLFRFFDSEVRAYRKLWADISAHLVALRAVASGQTKFTNIIREIAHKVVAGEVPDQWRALPYGASISLRSLDEWMLDLNRRVEQLLIVTQAYQGGAQSMSLDVEGAHEPVRAPVLQDLSGMLPTGSLSDLSIKCLWPGGLSNPKAFLSATQQEVAQLYKWPVDDLVMSLDIGNTEIDNQSFLWAGIYVCGATYDAQRRMLKLADSEMSRLPPTQLKWSRSRTSEGRRKRTSVKLPIFLTRARQECITTADFVIDDKEDPTLWYQRGVAFVLWWSV